MALPPPKCGEMGHCTGFLGRWNYPQWRGTRPKEGPNTQYRIHDAALGAFGIFFTQSPSFLDYQRTLQHTKGHNNAHTLLGVEQIPCDNQVRALLDPIAPSYLDPVFVEVFERLE